MSLNIARRAWRLSAPVAVFLAIFTNGHAQDAAPSASSTVAPKKAPKAKAMPGQWALVPESETSSKLAWQYTPGESEFLAIAISCDVATKEARVVVDLSTETKAKASQHLGAKLTKGDVTIPVAGKVESGESGPFVQATLPSAQVAQLLEQAGDLIVVLPHHRMSFSSRSLSGPYAAFVKTCQIKQGQ